MSADIRKAMEFTFPIPLQEEWFVEKSEGDAGAPELHKLMKGARVISQVLLSTFRDK